MSVPNVNPHVPSLQSPKNLIIMEEHAATVHHADKGNSGQHGHTVKYKMASHFQDG
jgi:hypothetical protein